MRMMNIDKAEVAYRFRKSVESYEENAHVQKEIVEHLGDLLVRHCPPGHPRILEIGCGTGLLTSRLANRYPHAELWVNDLVDAMCAKAAERCGVPSGQRLPGDIETLELPGCFSLVVSASTFQWLATPAETFSRLAQHIEPGGWMVFSTFGPDNYKELRTLTGEGLHYHTADELVAMLSPCFETLVAEENCCTIDFPHPIEILRHIKNTGVNGNASRRAWTPRRLELFMQEYTRRFAFDGQFPLTYHPLYFVCRRKQELF